MNRLLGCVLLLGVYALAQTPRTQNLQSTLLALKDANAPRRTLCNRLTEQMMSLTRRSQSPAQSTVQRFSEDLTTALVGRDITGVRAAAIEKAIADLLRGKGSNFMPASALRDTLTHLGIEEPAVQQIVQRFLDIGQEVRGPDDLGVRPRNFK